MRRTVALLEDIALGVVIAVGLHWLARGQADDRGGFGAEGRRRMSARARRLG